MTNSYADRAVRLLRLGSYHVRRLDWLGLNRFVNAKKVPIRNPIFLLGNQGGGLTFISRILRRNHDVVSCTGNAHYWTGGDEMQRVFAYVLPPTLRTGGRWLGGDPEHPQLTPPRSWSYGVDELVEQYHSTEANASTRERDALSWVIGSCLARYAISPQPRFLDKSQVFTLKTRHLQALLPGTEPNFVLIAREPFGSVYRAATGRAGDMARYHHLSEEEKVILCAQHWNNCMRIALDDAPHLKRFQLFRFEELVTDIGKGARALCEATGLAFDEDMLPQAHHKIPFATRYVERWYPLRTGNVSPPALGERYTKIISGICGETAERLGYVL